MSPHEDFYCNSDASDGISSGAGTTTQDMTNIKMVEIELDPEMMSTLCRRGRRRLRDIQVTCQAVVKLDRMHNILRVYGPEEVILAVRRQLASLGGPRKAVSPAVWAELMRTRTELDTTQSAVAQIQHESGCRIHIERSRLEVRLFGPDEGIAVAENLLEEIAQDCTEEALPLPVGSVAASVLQSVAHSHGVTICVEEEQIVTFGRTAQVKSAMEELASYSENLCKPQLSSECSAVILTALAAEIAPDKRIPTGKAGIVTTRRPPLESSEQVPKSQAKKAVQLTKQSDSSCQHMLCPTCGCGRFCVQCGAPTWRQPVSMSLASFATLPASFPLQSTTKCPSESKVGLDKTRAPEMDMPFTNGVQQFIGFDGAMPPLGDGATHSMPMMHAGMMPACIVPASMMQQIPGRGGGGPADPLNPAQDRGQYLMPHTAVVPSCMFAMGEQQMAFCPMMSIPYGMQESLTSAN